MKNNLTTRPLGSTELNVSTLGFGAASMGNLYHEVSDNDARKTLASAIDAKINLFDTAPRYGAGLSERRVGDALRPLDKDKYVISTKVGRILKPDLNAKVNELRHGFLTPMSFEAEYDYTYDGIIRSFEDSQQRLGLAHIDILLVHDLGADTHGSMDDYYFKQFASSGYKALEELKKDGRIKAVGLGVNEVDVCERVMNISQFDCFLLAGRYSLLEQAPLHGFLPNCIKHGASIILGGPYNSGILATGVKTNKVPYYNYAPAPKDTINRVDKIENVCQQHNVTLAAAALQFPLAHPAVASVIPGLSSSARVEKTLHLFNEKIPAAFWQQLQHEKLLDNLAPLPI
ncbi:MULTISPECIES: aldo/keto reductase [Pseudoalteromonas]|uniref:aldo/keto reductase n=1 Tax=Pseudoalteromonas TaxID=53246 RepID=UPI0006C9FB4B|nr:MULTISPECIES: aldo/keto reductase [Pseudoalteromonas]KPM75832.1 pyridoxal 4-dehydrogenase [Pseudoalteromonas sp. UCD-33C]KPW03663.1 Pyridoxal 4-dehydrogenase [Pseudoalteromonas sp. P1-8]MDK9684831.1 aldo/keto reductase [Pseudoalteromonas shioyasakiensis]